MVRNPRRYLDVSIGGEMEGQIVVDLYASMDHGAVRTAEKSRAICTGEEGASVPRLNYKVPSCWVPLCCCAIWYR
jgi:peptidyl-prolyl isomerase D